jgi:hypothetical protein
MSLKPKNNFRFQYYEKNNFEHDDRMDGDASIHAFITVG